jgi:5,10-methylenetetrahydromethanopterin reductase
VRVDAGVCKPVAMSVEVFLGLFPIPARIATYAQMAERDGWDGLAVTDSQTNNGDSFCALSVAAVATERIKLTTSATNAVTRHPSVVAGAIASIHAESNGRAILGIGRGDSSVRSIGRELMPLGDFRRALDQIQAYLRGETVTYADGRTSRMAWLQAYNLPKVPVSVSATGPRTIEIGALVADRITFSLGADLDRMRWAIDLARATRAQAGLDPAGLSLGAYVNTTAHPDAARARELVRPRLNTYARHWTMHANARRTLAAEDDALVDQVKRQQATLSDDFVDRHAIAGPSDYVIGRLRQLIELGLDHLIVVGYAGTVDPDALADGSQRFGAEIIPALRG